MYPRVLAILAVCISTDSITVNNAGRRAITSKSKIELNPIVITCGLSDIIVLTAPFSIDKNSSYYLSKPNGDNIKLELPRLKTNRIAKNSTSYDTIVVKYFKNGVKLIRQGLDFKKIFNLIFRWARNDFSNTYEENTKEIEANDIFIGPLLEEDRGNWVLSIYVKDTDDNWIEFFQVITIEIRDTVPASIIKPQLITGDTFNLSFAYPIKKLESCEIVAPKSTFDRFFDRNRIDLDNCGFKIPNITKEDEGIWRIIGVGTIVYEARVFLKVIENKS